MPEAWIRIRFSGNKGFHIIIPAIVFGGFTPSPDLPGSGEHPKVNKIPTVFNRCARMNDILVKSNEKQPICRFPLLVFHLRDER